MGRRQLLRGVAVVSVAASAPGVLAGCSKKDDDTDARTATYPQGLASGDPKPDSVILWTRVQPSAEGPVAVKLEVATDKAFTKPVASKDLTADPQADYTLRVKLTNLSAYTTYYYRFTAEGVTSVVGRTKTAPKPDQDVSPKFAFASCQDYNGRYFHAYKHLAKAAEDPKTDLDFVLHLGDYIYETEGDPRFQDPTSDRRITIAEGIEIGDAMAKFKAAKTLGDYRSLFKQYKSDPDLQAVHALFPFINGWDDHEFADDCWQDHSTHFNDAKGDEKDSSRRHAASRAWFEYQPADIDFSDGAAFPKDIKIYRQLRYGKHLDVFITDQRYFRSDHVIPEGPKDDKVAKLTENSAVGSRFFLLKSGFDPKETAAKPTMLGKEQKDWLVNAVTSSNATWKIWANEVQLAQMCVDLKEFPKVPEPYNDKFYITCDQWDGWRSERQEILTQLATASNLVALTGDIHAFYASELHVDFDKPAAKPVAVEYVVAGITSGSLQEIVEKMVNASQVFKSLGLAELVPKMDELIQKASPHYKYAKSKANGVATVAVNATTDIEVNFIHLKESVTSKTFGGGVDQVRFRTKSGSNTVEKV
jgi:alkaline phosphatase D